MRATTWPTAAVAALIFANFTTGQEPPPDAPPPPPPRPSADGGPTPGMGGPGGMGVGGVGAPGYSVTWYPTRHVTPASGGTDLGLLRQSVSAPVPLWHDGGDTLMMSVGVGNTLFFTDARFPDSRRAFPDELWNVRLGVNYAHRFENGWSLMVGTNVGSASDKPFHSINEINAGFMSMLRVPVCEGRDAWTFSLMYSPLGNVNVPIPGVAYAWNPSDELHVSIGLPFSVNWRPTADWSLNLSYVPLTNVNAMATYRAAEGLRVYGGFTWANEGYFLADRAVTSDRFLGFEKRLLAGVTWQVWRAATLDVNAGYAFDRYYGFGDNVFGSLRDQVDVAPGAFLGARLGVRY